MANNRIRELAEQACTGWDDDNRWYVNSETMTRFAELIILECSSVALREDHEPSECILTHFNIIGK